MKIFAGVEDFFWPYKAHEPQFLDINQLSHLTKISNNEVLRNAIYATGFKTGISWIDAEIISFMDRFFCEQPDINEENYVLSGDGNFDLSFESFVVTNWAPPDSIINRHFRLKSHKEKIIKSSISNIYISYHWLKDNEIILWDGLRTKFPFNIDSNREFSYPIKIKTPREPGEYTLELELIEEDVCWISSSKKQFEFNVCLKNYELPTFRENHNYSEDHVIALRMVDNFIKSQAERKLRILEIGAGMNPQMAYFSWEHEFVANDVCLNLCILGKEYYRGLGLEIRFSVFDATNPPIEIGKFDLVVMFSALHHMNEPAKFLVNIKRILTDDGIIAVMCEPVGASLGDEGFIRDFKNGINEQLFEYDEYLELFKISGLQIREIQIDGVSLKAILSKN
jgi:SAM-dependent methyltransferase